MKKTWHASFGYGSPGCALHVDAVAIVHCGFMEFGIVPQYFKALKEQTNECRQHLRPGNIKNLIDSFVFFKSWRPARTYKKILATLEILQFHMLFHSFGIWPTF